MVIEWIEGFGWNCRAEIEENIMDERDYDRIMAEREIAIKYWAKDLAESMLCMDGVY